MLKYEVRLLGQCVEYGRKLVADIDDAVLAEQPSPGVNHPAWILGHLAVVADRACQLLGEPTGCPESWREIFGRGSTPAADRSVYPSKTELWDAFDRGHARVADGARRIDDAGLDAPNPFEPMRERFPTTGDLLSALMTTHLAVHLGQLSAWRRQMKLPAV